MIAVDDLTLRAGTFIIEGITFAIDSGQYAVLMGKTGCGKTTLLETIAGLKSAVRGRILLTGRDVTRLATAERGIGYLPQDLALFPTMTVREHLAFAPRLRRWPETDISRRVKELVDLLGIGSLLERLPVGLSGGESQRVALGRALSFRPQVLLLDEPLSALDDETRSEMYKLLRAVQTQTGVTVLHVTHNSSEAAALADRLFVIRDGHLREESAAREPK
jgi:molybdate/tungstate transport system ATP-binding protein